jgi:hypothetical protein
MTRSRRQIRQMSVPLSIALAVAVCAPPAVAQSPAQVEIQVMSTGDCPCLTVVETNLES